MVSMGTLQLAVFVVLKAPHAAWISKNTINWGIFTCGFPSLHQLKAGSTSRSCVTQSGLSGRVSIYSTNKYRYRILLSRVAMCRGIPSLTWGAATRVCHSFNIISGLIVPCDDKSQLESLPFLVPIALILPVADQLAHHIFLLP